MRRPALIGALATSLFIVPVVAIIVHQQASRGLLDRPTSLGLDTAPPRQPAPERKLAQRLAPEPEESADATGGSTPQPAAVPPPVASAPLEQFASTRRQQATVATAPVGAESAPQPGYRDEGRDRFERFEPNKVTAVAEQPVSTFSIDVDTASYAFVRRQLMAGVLPPREAVRVEEMINYFDYDYARPAADDAPFRATVALYPTPWNPDSRLLHIGLQGREVAAAQKPRANLVFLVDVSGSMDSPDKLPLVKSALRLLLDGLADGDSVALVTYAGQSGVALEPTPVRQRGKILAALEALGAGGSTAGAAGLETAYALAREAFDEAGVNRVILATDGDFNVGITDLDELEAEIERQRRSGIFLSVLGFGQGNYNDALMQILAQNGNGTAAYIDSLREAHKVLVEEASSALFPIASDVKIQVEFNPAAVAEYRLIGYESRRLERADFNDDRVDAGDISSGHRVTALYEIVPAGGAGRLVDDLRYQAPDAAAPAGRDGELAFLRLRYKLPGESESKLTSVAITEAMAVPSVERLPDDLRFAAAVAAFGQKLGGSRYLDEFGYDRVLELATPATGNDPFGYRTEFLALARLAKSLSEGAAAADRP